ncbi:4-galactosyl-N-acetylglucosaminide 3-alpha-L-fucosyltransferase FUT5-like [Styela clava]
MSWTIPRMTTKKLSLIIIVCLVITFTWFVGYWQSSSFFSKYRYGNTGIQPIKYIPKTTNVTKTSTVGPMLSPAQQDELKVRLKKATDKKIILVWISGFGAKVTATVDPEKCGNCEVTQDRGLLNDERTGAIILHFDALRSNNVPPTRNPNHLYLFWVMEATVYVSKLYSKVIEFADQLIFNGTYTHRRDADFYSPYGNVESMTNTILEGNKMTPKQLLQMKSKLAVAIASNCDVTPGAKTRKSMLQELISYGVLEGFGRCLGGANFANGHRRDATHHEEVRKYKFYFAFENSHHCKDYITEKFFDNALSGFAVPVVWGAKREDYEAIAPTGSFIYAEDFSSMKELAEYIVYLDQNDDAYLEYLEWTTMKPSELPEYGRQTGWCQICRALHGINVDDIFNPNYDSEKPERPLFTNGIAKRTVTPSLTGWFVDGENSNCFRG